MVKRKNKDEEDEHYQKEKIKKARTDLSNYDFFHDKPESSLQLHNPRLVRRLTRSRSVKKDIPSVLVCNGEQYNVFPRILEICSSSFSQRWMHVMHESRNYVNLDSLDICCVQVYANWAMDHEKPALIAINDNEGDIMHDVIVCYLTARKLRAYLLCDLILSQACEIGKETELIVRHAQTTKTYTETKNPEAALRSFLSALVAYQCHNGLDNPIAGRDPRPDKQRARFEALPEDFRFDLMNELSKNTAPQNPCHRPRRFLRVVVYHMQKKEEKRAAAERARLEARGTEASPLFVDEEDEE
ncbi:unnamed protein product [Aureobasidium vineae]|uniref:Uncharacterized protein n=1 Tax=Aureobasidium vineae TaxID=2773715 RepID=A0A9N8P8N6_9PEZI|nr:unnamed protein product [Aureobasidium vineae]